MQHKDVSVFQYLLKVSLHAIVAIQSTTNPGVVAATGHCAPSGAAESQITSGFSGFSLFTCGSSSWRKSEPLEAPSSALYER